MNSVGTGMGALLCVTYKVYINTATSKIPDPKITAKRTLYRPIRIKEQKNGASTFGRSQGLQHLEDLKGYQICDHILSCVICKLTKSQL